MMRKIMRDPQKTTLLEISFGEDWPLRLEKISEQTGLSPTSLLQKWILQEETFIGLALGDGMRGAEQARVPRNVASPEAFVPIVAPEQEEEDAEDEPLKLGNPAYRKMIRKKARKLKEAGMTLKTIADAFNDENVSTVSGTGKWYSSSIAKLLLTKV